MSQVSRVFMFLRASGFRLTCARTWTSLTSCSTHSWTRHHHSHDTAFTDQRRHSTHSWRHRVVHCSIQLQRHRVCSTRGTCRWTRSRCRHVWQVRAVCARYCISNVVVVAVASVVAGRSSETRSLFVFTSTTSQMFCFLADSDARFRCVYELAESERFYQENLRSVFDLYAEPLR